MRYPLFIFIALMLSYLAFGETIEMRNGKKIVCKILKETEAAVLISKLDGSLTYVISKDRIKRIRKSTDDEASQEKAEIKGINISREEHITDEDYKAKREEIKKYRLQRYEQQVLSAKKARGRIKIEFSKGRFGVVDAELEGAVTAALLVDTGASMVVISRKIADQLGFDESRIEGKMHVVLADGSLTTAKRITLKSVIVGSSRVKNVEAAITEDPGSGIDGLLGMSFLKHFHVKMDAKDNCLVLEKY